MKKVSAMLLRNGVPGDDLLRFADDLLSFREWFDAHGAAYIRSLKF